MLDTPIKQACGNSIYVYQAGSFSNKMLMWDCVKMKSKWGKAQRSKTTIHPTFCFNFYPLHCLAMVGKCSEQKYQILV
jgi:hypothetical protein